MSNERTYSCLPCADIDEAVTFYQALGFNRTYYQVRPNPYAVVQFEDIHIHLFGMENFNPETSYGNVIIVVPDPDALYQTFSQGLKSAYKKIPRTGIPRILRPRKKLGTVYGFSVVDVGGNWLRISKLNETESADKADKASGLLGFLHTATRLGDAKGDDALALKTLEKGVQRFPDAPPIELANALLYQAELALRLQQKEVAQQSLAKINSLDLTASEQQNISEELNQLLEQVEES